MKHCEKGNVPADHYNGRFTHSDGLVSFNHESG